MTAKKLAISVIAMISTFYIDALAAFAIFFRVVS